MFRTFLALAVCLFSLSARADDPRLTIGAGVFDLVAHRDHLAEGRVSYRLGDGLFDNDGTFRGLKPFVAGMVNSKGGLFGYAGLAAPFQWDNGLWEFEPSAGLGAYHRGTGIDAGGTFEFHLGLAGSYAINDNARLGVAITHISNAGTHKKNPGINSALLTWSWSFRD